MPVKRVGVELEYPISGGTKYVSRGDRSEDLHSELSGHGWSPSSGRLTWDGTVGVEVVSNPIPPNDAKNWYRDVIDELESNWHAPFEPVGLLTDTSTAGLHMHLSELTEGQAQTLRQWSQESWLQVFTGSSVVGGADPDYRVFRGGRYCRMGDIHGSRYNVVNCRSEIDGHYEWRLPEPMTRDHFDMVMEFVDRFIEDPADAKHFAHNVLADERSMGITAVERAEHVGIDEVQRIEVAREPHPDTEGFYDEVESDSSLPYIHLVRIEGDEYYAFDGSATPPFRAGDMLFDMQTVFDAPTLTRVMGERQEYVNNIVANDGLDPRESEATPLLKDVVKKKKGTPADADDVVLAERLDAMDEPVASTAIPDDDGDSDSGSTIGSLFG